MAMVIDPIAKKPFFNFFSIKGSYLLKPTLLAPDRALCCVQTTVSLFFSNQIQHIIEVVALIFGIDLCRHLPTTVIIPNVSFFSFIVPAG